MFIINEICWYKVNLILLFNNIFIDRKSRKLSITFTRTLMGVIKFIEFQFLANKLQALLSHVCFNAKKKEAEIDVFFRMKSMLKIYKKSKF